MGVLGTGTAFARPFAYISNYQGNNVSVIDIATNTVIATVPVGPNPIGVAVNAAGTFAYVANLNGSSVSVIDAVSNSVVATVLVGGNPIGVAVNAMGTFVYVANGRDNTVSVIDTSTNVVVATVAVGTAPYGIALNPAGTLAYVANPTSSNVSVIDTATDTVIATVPVGLNPVGVAINPAGTLAYVTNLNTNDLSVIDTASNNVVATVPVGTYPIGVAVNPAGSVVYVVNGVGHTVSVVDSLTNAVIAVVPVGNAPQGVAFNPAGTFAYVTNQYSNDVSVIDTNTNVVVTTVPVGTDPAAFGNFIGGNSFTVTPTAGPYGSISPSTPQTVNYGATTSFTVTPNTAYSAVVGGTCGGTLVGTAYTTNTITSNCTVIVNFTDTTPPIVSGVTASPNPVAINTWSTVTANVDDSTTGGSNIVSADYNIDGGAFSPMTAVFNQVSVNVIASVAPFATAGLHTLCVQGTDAAGNVSASQCALLVVYDPTGGFVTGGGTVNSAAGADLMNTSAAGPASFGFNSKYLKGKSTPDGSLEFQFKAGNLEFKSTSMDWLVVTGEPRAQFQGTGTINGTTVCKFAVDAWDASFQSTTASNADAFGLKIFSCAGGGDRYSLPATALKQGSIIIHK